MSLVVTPLLRWIALVVARDHHERNLQAQLLVEDVDRSSPFMPPTVDAV